MQGHFNVHRPFAITYRYLCTCALPKHQKRARKNQFFPWFIHINKHAHGWSRKGPKTTNCSRLTTRKMSPVIPTFTTLRESWGLYKIYSKLCNADFDIERSFLGPQPPGHTSTSTLEMAASLPNRSVDPHTELFFYWLILPTIEKQYTRRYTCSHRRYRHPLGRMRRMSKHGADDIATIQDGISTLTYRVSRRLKLGSENHDRRTKKCCSSQ